MATITYDESSFIGQVRTTDATLTDVPGLVWTPADKTSETYVIEAKALQENASNPLAWYQLRIALVKWTGGVPIFVGGSDGASGIVKQHGDAAWACTMVVAGGGGGTVKVQVTGAAATNLNWITKVSRQVFSSTP